MSGAAIIFLVTAGVSLAGLFGSPAIIQRLILRPYWVQRKGQYERLVTSGFVHADFAHLVFNLLTFYFFAFSIERYIGTARFLMLYFAGLICANIGTTYKQRNNPDYATLGASGAILAVLFAAIVYFPHQSLFILPIPIPIPAPLFAVGYLVYSYWSSRHATAGRVNHDAHIAGAITGLLFVAVTDPFAYRQLAGMLGFDPQ
ncbi:MAG: rhomboid family intramembrane serine protease [Proteobacteria bacterium]|nr:rhomboid family intramembrane serine protease [Pseudomonadota bacterium]